MHHWMLGWDAAALRAWIRSPESSSTELNQPTMIIIVSKHYVPCLDAIWCGVSTK